jgi:hypothetical protein
MKINNNNRKISFILVFLGILIISVTMLRLIVIPRNLKLLKEQNNDASQDLIDKNVLFENFSPISDIGDKFQSFSNDGLSIYYFSHSGQLVKRDLTNDEELILLENLPFIEQIAWNEKEQLIILDWKPGIMTNAALNSYNYNNGNTSNIAEDAWGAAWAPDFSQISYIHIENNKEGLWLSNKNGEKQRKISDLEGMFSPEYVSWSSLGTRLIVQGATGVQFFLYQEDKAVELSWIPWVKESSWSPDGWLLAYRIKGDEADTLWVANQDGNEQKQVFEGIFSEVNWLPDGRLVFFTPAKEGGASCWALDPHTGTKELLADSSTVIYKPIDHIAVSPKGDALAFVAQDQRIWLLKLQNISD